MNNSRWPLRPIGDCAKFLSGGTPNKTRAEFWEGEIPWVSSGEMTHRRIYDTSLHISEDGARKGSRLVPENTVLAVVRGMSLAKEFRICITKREVAFNQDIKAFECSPNVDPEFFFYALLARREHIRDLASEASHGTKRLETDVLSAFEIPVPRTREVQRRVVEVLGAYDDLIENNRRRTALLEQATRLLYREWFVRLRFPGYEHTHMMDGVPDGWERMPLGDRIVLNYGKALNAEVRTEGPFPVYGSSGIVGTHDKALVAAPGIVLGRKGNVGSVYWCAKDYWPIDTVYFVGSGASNLWLYFALQHMHFMSTDVAVPGLNRDFAYSRPLLVPHNRVLRSFLEISEPVYEQVAKLEEMTDKLRSARDLLLPRLTNGEIAV